MAMITLLMAIAVTQSVRELHLDAKIKWPNDVVVNGKKICGILTEMYPSADGSFFLVIGTGINVNQKEFPEEVKRQRILWRWSWEPMWIGKYFLRPC